MLALQNTCIKWKFKINIKYFYEDKIAICLIKQTIRQVSHVWPSTKTKGWVRVITACCTRAQVWGDHVYSLSLSSLESGALVWPTEKRYLSRSLSRTWTHTQHTHSFPSLPQFWRENTNSQLEFGNQNHSIFRKYKRRNREKQRRCLQQRMDSRETQGFKPSLKPLESSLTFQKQVFIYIDILIFLSYCLFSTFFCCKYI